LEQLGWLAEVRRALIGPGLGLPRPKRRHYVYFTHGQVLALASEAGRWRLLILLLAYTGLRRGEATAPRVCDIDFGRRRVDVRCAFSDVGGHIIPGTPKSHQSWTVPVPRFITIELAGAVDGKRPDDLIFTMPRRQRHADAQLAAGHLRPRPRPRGPQRPFPRP
jgi:hypothetical protein